MRYLLYKLPGARVVLMGLFPRGDPPGYLYKQPSIFSMAHNMVNEAFRCVCVWKRGGGRTVCC